MKTQSVYDSNRQIVNENIALRRFVPMLSRFFFGIFLLLSFSANAQELKLAKIVVGDFDYLTTDHIGRLYLAKRDELFLYSEEGELMYQYSDLSLGTITNVDTRNPLKL
ncbi:MAG: hypothetical protein ACJATE_002018, partial [Bacteroidia bacterium]